MKTIKWALVYDTVLEESKETLVVEINGRVHTGALLFEIDFSETVGRVIEEVQLGDDVSEVELLNKIVDVYLRNEKTVHTDTEKTIRHWFSVNGVNSPAFVYDPKNYSETIKVGKRSFRYNKKNCMLEYFDTKTNKVLTSVGLSRESAEGDLRYWVEEYNDQLQAEFSNALRELHKNK